ncbi:TA system antitoxin ParD family protein [Magnetovibrio blakemorei]|uniref:ParD-like antitoxin of type II toxin-antitoxin system n=1 Tax=Magnetovibrio blakemorei TaxID=28181 RepID=A0A1E5Q582_9PROT|nr:hypothetical protein [Magnetovibrio blakemorei]OEJ65522.1 hypothetical protein BEN30_14165 [Magnetovibrio blakemorei]
MTKAASPIRLQDELMKAAQATGKAYHRSRAEQVEYWADLGRKVSDILNPDTLLAVKSGLATLTIEATKPVDIDPDNIFTTLDRKRANGTLAMAISDGKVRYQMSQAQPGMLEQIAADGTVQVGQFINGNFEPEDAA